MDRLPSVTLRLTGPAGEPACQIRIFAVGGDPKQLLRDLTDRPDEEPDLERIQLLEGAEYRYVVEGVSAPFLIDSPLFSPDPDDPHSGRLRPGLATGSVPVQLLRPSIDVESPPEVIGRGAFEVRAKKLGYLDEYRRMLEDLTSWFTELVMERFAPSELAFRIDQSGTAATLYQRFAFIKSLMEAPPFEAAIYQILTRPHRRWVEELEPRRPGQPLPPSSVVARQLVRPGRRVEWPGAPGGLPLHSLPAEILVPRTVQSLDTAENRFVRFVLERWQELLLQVRERLVGEPDSSPVARGVREVDVLLGRLGEWLSAPLFAEVGRLTHLPGNSQVLQKRIGYRELLRAFSQVEAAATLSWQGEGDLFKAGQRDVATLYEVWVLYQVASLLAQETKIPWDGASLLTVSDNGLSIQLQGGKRPILAGTVERQGRRLDLALYYNLTFSRGPEEAWSRPMRPDLSLRIKSAAGNPAPFEPVWIHFDAKYRVSEIKQFFGTADDGVIATERSEERQGRTLRADLLKMHAYRDAIKRSAGAYVIYPGTQEEPLRRYHEILPGLGAFPLRPEKDGREPDTAELRTFLEEVLGHLASQVTQHERGRFWEDAIFREPPAMAPKGLPVVPFLESPPADTKVLLGYTRAEWHVNWIEANGLYNLRAGEDRPGAIALDSDALNAEFLLVHGRSVTEARLYRIQGRPEVHTRESLEATGYQKPNGDRYFCLPVRARQELPPAVATQVWQWLQTKRTEKDRRGHPRVVRWLELLS